MTTLNLWPITIRLSDVDRKDQRLHLQADPAVRTAVAKLFDLAALDEFEGTVRASPWLDGAILQGEWSAQVTQTCVLTLEPLPAKLSGKFSVKLLPAGSPNAPSEEPDPIVDPDADDPPDLLDGEEIPVGDYLVEYLGLELDPFPRKPGAVFVAPEEPTVITPFSALKNFRPKGDAD